MFENLKSKWVAKKELARRKKLVEQYFDKIIKTGEYYGNEQGILLSKHWSYLNEDKDSIDVRFESFFSPFGASKIITLIYKGKFLKEVWRQNVWETKYFDGYWFHAMERYCTSDLFKDREVSESLIKW